MICATICPLQAGPPATLSPLGICVYSSIFISRHILGRATVRSLGRPASWCSYLGRHPETSLFPQNNRIQYIKIDLKIGLEDVGKVLLFSTIYLNTLTTLNLKKSLTRNSLEYKWRKARHPTMDSHPRIFAAVFQQRKHEQNHRKPLLYFFHFSDYKYFQTWRDVGISTKASIIYYSSSGHVYAYMC